MLYCKQCEKYCCFGNDITHGVCTLPESYFPTEADNPCVFLAYDKLTCSSCSHYGTDFACMTADANDEICSGYEDKSEEELIMILFGWLKRGEYNREHVMKLCERFEGSDVYKFVQQHIESML